MLGITIDTVGLSISAEIFQLLVETMSRRLAAFDRDRECRTRPSSPALVRVKEFKIFFTECFLHDDGVDGSF